MAATKNTDSLSRILEHALRLKNQVVPPNRPHIERGLEQIESQSQQLLTRVTGEEDPFGTKTQLFLAKGGVNTDELQSHVQDTRMDMAFEATNVLPDIDVEGFLRLEHEQSVIEAIEEGSKETAAAFDEYAEAVMQHDWNEYKRALLTQEGAGYGIDTRHGESMLAFSHQSCFEESFATKSFLGRDIKMNTSVVARTARYLEIVKQLNETRLVKGNFAIISAFEETTRAMGTEQWRQLAQCWRTLAGVLGEKDARGGEFRRQPLVQGQFMQAYNDPKSPAHVEMRQRFIVNAREHLEEQFFQYMDDQVHTNLRAANLTGVPSVLHTVQAFLNLPAWRDSILINPNIEVIENQPIWAITYMLIRGGKYDEARDYVTKNRMLFDVVEPAFQEYLVAYLKNGHRLPKILNDRLHAEFNQRLRHAREKTDPYKFALYKIIGRCELRRKTVQEVVHTVEDYIWMQLMLLSDEHDANVGSSERYTPSDLQEVLLKFGPDHFSQQGANPLRYLQVLLLSGQFERAVAYLYDQDEFYCEAVHFAIAMAYYGVIRVADEKATYERPVLSMCKDASGALVPCLDYAKVIYQYAHYFRTSAEDAFHYLTLLCLFGDNTPSAKFLIRCCHTWMRDLILNTKEFDLLLGKANPDGSVSPGCMQRYAALAGFETTKELTNTVTIRAAEVCEFNGQALDAVKLFNLGEEYDHVYRVLISQLGSYLALHRQRLQQGIRATSDEIVEQAREIRARYENQPQILARISIDRRQTLNTLLQLHTFFVDCSYERYDQALQLMEELRLLPLNGDLPTIMQYCDDINNMDDAIVRNLPEFVLATMDAIYNIHRRFKESLYTDLGRQDKMAQLRAKARSLMVFAGMNQYRTPADVYAQLNRLDVLMG